MVFTKLLLSSIGYGSHIFNLTIAAWQQKIEPRCTPPLVGWCKKVGVCWLVLDGIGRCMLVGACWLMQVGWCLSVGACRLVRVGWW